MAGRRLKWSADSRQVVCIMVNSVSISEEMDAYFHVLTIHTVIHNAAIDLDGAVYWIDAQGCGDTVFLIGISKPDQPSVYRLYSVPAANPAQRTELFRAYGIDNMACEARR